MTKAQLIAELDRWSDDTEIRVSVFDQAAGSFVNNYITEIKSDYDVTDDDRIYFIKLVAE